MYRIFSVFFALLILSGCGALGGVRLKKSANNKLIDAKGFHGSKRMPLYNKKYIDRAKNNILRGDFDEEEFDDEETYVENLPSPLKNRYIYEDMIQEDIESERSKRARKRSRYMKRFRESDRGYPHIGRARDKVSAHREAGERAELKSELQEIKSLLDEARKDLAKYRCPTDENQEIPVKKHDTRAKQNIHEQVKSEDAEVKRAPTQSHTPASVAAPQEIVTKPTEPVKAATQPQATKPNLEVKEQAKDMVASPDPMSLDVSKKESTIAAQDNQNPPEGRVPPVTEDTSKPVIEGLEAEEISSANKSSEIPPIPSIPDVVEGQN